MKRIVTLLFVGYSLISVSLAGCAEKTAAPPAQSEAEQKQIQQEEKKLQDAGKM